MYLWILNKWMIKITTFMKSIQFSKFKNLNIIFRNVSCMISSTNIKWHITKCLQKVREKTILNKHLLSQVTFYIQNFINLHTQALLIVTLYIWHVISTILSSFFFIHIYTDIDTDTHAQLITISSFQMRGGSKINKNICLCVYVVKTSIWCASPGLSILTFLQSMLFIYFALRARDSTVGKVLFFHKSYPSLIS